MPYKITCNTMVKRDPANRGGRAYSAGTGVMIGLRNLRPGDKTVISDGLYLRILPSIQRLLAEGRIAVTQLPSRVPSTISENTEVEAPEPEVENQPEAPEPVVETVESKEPDAEDDSAAEANVGKKPRGRKKVADNGESSGS